MDTAIKALTVLKLLLQCAFYGILLGVLLWFLLDNPIPKMIEGVQKQVIQGLMTGGK